MKKQMISSFQPRFAHEAPIDQDFAHLLQVITR